MSTNEVRSKDATSDASVARVDMKLEVDVIPVSDLDRAGLARRVRDHRRHA